MLTRKQRWRRVRVVRFTTTATAGVDVSSPATTTAIIAATPWRGVLRHPSTICSNTAALNFEEETPPSQHQQQQQRQTSTTTNSCNNADKATTRTPPPSSPPESLGPVACPLEESPSPPPGFNLFRFLLFFAGGGGWGGANGDAEERQDDGTVGDGGRARAATDGCRALTTASRPRRPSEPGCRPRPRGRVRFNHQIRVVLVASRVEMSSVKADVWWGEEDYCGFRCVFLPF